MQWTPMYMLIMSLGPALLRFVTFQFPFSWWFFLQLWEEIYLVEWVFLDLMRNHNLSVILTLGASKMQLFLLQSKVPSVKSVISKASGSKADMLIEPGEKIHFGNLFLEVGVQVVVSFNVSICQVEYHQCFGCCWAFLFRCIKLKLTSKTWIMRMRTI